MEELFSARGIDPARVQARLEKAAGEVGLPFGKRGKTYNSRLAQELGKWAEEEGRGDAFHMAMFKAYFVDGINLADIDLLVELAESIPLNGVAARRILEERVYQHAVDRDWQRAHALGITAVPTFLANGRRLVGAQTYEALEMLIQD